MPRKSRTFHQAGDLPVFALVLDWLRGRASSCAVALPFEGRDPGLDEWPDSAAITAETLLEAGAAAIVSRL